MQYKSSVYLPAGSRYVHSDTFAVSVNKKGTKGYTMGYYNHKLKKEVRVEKVNGKNQRVIEYVDVKSERSFSKPKRVYQTSISKYDLRAVRLRLATNVFENSRTLGDKVKFNNIDTSEEAMPPASIRIVRPEFKRLLTQKEASKDADVIVRGTISETKPMKGTLLPEIQQSLKINHVYKGHTKKDSLAFQQLGGKNVLVPESFNLHSKQKVILYLKRGLHGKYFLVNEGTGIFVSLRSGRYTQVASNRQFNTKEVVTQ